MSEEIEPQHLQRKASLYDRQSSTYQVNNNLESQKLQYAMQGRLRQLGCCEIEVVDEDLGLSAAGTVVRSAFERMVAEVCLGKVGGSGAGGIALCRNSREWQQLVEVYRVVDTLLIDHETVYAPRQGNDRLLLGLKGNLNEYELDLLCLWSVEARHAKARRGELVAIRWATKRVTTGPSLESALPMCKR
jgi:DNA invertase Pin-like site-specific DNA recombinase